MGDIDVDLGRLPDDVRERLAELDLELSEGNECFQIVLIKSL